MKRRVVLVASLVLLLAAFIAANSLTGASSTLPDPSSAPLVSFVTDDFAGSGICAVCHSLLKDTAGNDVSNDSHWRSTMMANSAKDPLWLAKVSSEIARNPQLESVIEGKCATCHMPMASTQARADGGAVGILAEGFRNAAHPLHKAAMDGVSCTLCHQINKKGLGKERSFSGGYVIDTKTSKPNKVINGPFKQPFQNLMQSFTGFLPVYGKQTLRSELCATCHTLFTPYVNAEGEVLGDFPEQTPYLEWEHSKYSARGDGRRTCQQCHMPEADGPVIISNRPQGMGMGGVLKPREPFAQHHFVGGNAFMLGLMKANADKLWLTAQSQHLDATITRTMNQIQSRAVNLSVAEAGLVDGILTIRLKLETLTGHKFPTGFPSRRAWIEFTVKDGGGKEIFRSGKSRKNGKINGNDADRKASTFEPHYDVITSPGQVQIYEAIMENSDGAVTYTLLRGAGYAKDNRLLPAGFDKAKAGDEIAVHGNAENDGDFTGGSDTLTYRVDVSGHSGPFDITANLLYQSVSYRFVKDLRSDRTAEIKAFTSYYDKRDNSSTLVKSTSQTVQ
ncbi:MAG TPA: hypothetical protein VMX35_05645 [Acidobacteriota bacterium]|nr:hypothetical protein [Acidobacteriota bacterium]